MPGFGESFRRERQRRGLHLADVARDINVGAHLLEALEKDDLTALPGGPFNRGIVRAYARRLAMDLDDTVRRYGRAERARGLNTPDAEHEPRQRRVELRRDGDRPTLVIDWGLARVVLTVGAAAIAAGVIAIFLLTGGPAGGDARRAAAPPEVQVAGASLDASVDVSAGTGSAAHPTDSPIGNTPPRPSRPPAEPPSQRDEGRLRPETAGEALAPIEPASKLNPPAGAMAAESPSTSAPDTAGRAAAGAETDRSDSTMRVRDAGLGQHVQDRRLVGVSDTFRVGERVWFWTRTLDGTGETIEHVWLHGGRSVARHVLDIGGPDWRNSTFKTLWGDVVGPWAVEARDAAGGVLARREFVCVDPADGNAGTAASVTASRQD